MVSVLHVGRLLVISLQLSLGCVNRELGAIEFSDTTRTIDNHSMICGHTILLCY